MMVEAVGVARSTYADGFSFGATDIWKGDFSSAASR